MALLAGDGRMLFHERISSLAMIECLERRLPMNEGKILAVVLQVAAHAVPAVGILHRQKRVVALMLAETVRNFLVAFQALERRRAGSELVAGVALRRAVKRLMRFRERPGRNLGAGAGGHEKDSAEYQQTTGDQADGQRHSADSAAHCVCKDKQHQLPPTDRSWRVNRR